MKSFIAVIVLALLVAGGWMFWTSIGDKAVEVVPTMTPPTIVIPARFENITLQTDEFQVENGLGVYHSVSPVTENRDVNALIAADAAEFRNEFLITAEQIPTTSSTTLQYRQHFDVSFANDTYVAFTIEQTRQIGTSSAVMHRSFVFNRETGVLIPTKDLFSDPLYEKRLRELIQSELQKSNRSSQILTVENIAFDSETATVYVPNDEAPAPTSDIPVTLPLSEISTSLKPEVLQVIESADTTTSIKRNEPPVTRAAVDCSLVPCVALTFDDGPGSYTDSLLDTLKAEGVPATFFLIGRSVQYLPHTINRMYAEGHDIGNHTWDHPDLKYLSELEIQSQLERTDAAVASVIGVKTMSLRPPYGSFNATVQSVAARPLVLWNVDPEDWSTRNTSAIVSGMTGAPAGSVVLSHDIYAETVAAIPAVIADYKRRGFTFVTIPDLYAPQELQDGVAYYGL